MTIKEFRNLKIGDIIIWKFKTVFPESIPSRKSFTVRFLKYDYIVLEEDPIKDGSGFSYKSFKKYVREIPEYLIDE